jgi:hypothetical protein
VTVDKDKYTISETARLLGVSRKVIHQAIADGKLHPLPKSSLYRDPSRAPTYIPRAEVEAALAALRR